MPGTKFVEIPSDVVITDADSGEPISEQGLTESKYAEIRESLEKADDPKAKLIRAWKPWVFTWRMFVTRVLNSPVFSKSLDALSSGLYLKTKFREDAGQEVEVNADDLTLFVEAAVPEILGERNSAAMQLMDMFKAGKAATDKPRSRLKAVEAVEA